jgi:agmatine deiminase
MSNCNQSARFTRTSQQRMPAEWEQHRATWIAWPYLESDFPGKVDAVRWAYCEFVRHVSRVERVEILCLNEAVAQDARSRLSRLQITGDIRIHQTPYNRSWLRDSGPIGVFRANGSTMSWVSFLFTGWGALPEVELDQQIPSFIARTSARDLNVVQANSQQPVLEGGMLDVSGDGLILVTEECLLSEQQQRNAGFTKRDYEEIFSSALGATSTIWLPHGVAGDDTHGHIDNVARFVDRRTVVVAAADESDREQYEKLQENVSTLRAFRTPEGEALTVVELPFPEPRYCDGMRFPAGYLNFYFANSLLLVPTYNDTRDRYALGILSDLCPARKVVGIHCGDWIIGGGSLHCSTQQEPLEH